MSLTYQEAVDIVQAKVKTAWDTTAYAANMHWEEVVKTRTTNAVVWADTRIRHTNGFQSTVGGAIGNSLYNREGMVTVRIHAVQGKGLQNSYALAKVLADEFETNPSNSGVWYRNVRVQELGRDGEYFVVAFIAEFEYYERK